MESELLDFDAWWREFLRSASGQKDPFSAEDELIRYVAAQSPQLRTVFLQHLVDLGLAADAGWSLALAALKRTATSSERDAIASALRRSLNQSTDLPNDHHEALLRILARDPSEKYLDLLRSYLLESPIGHYWSTVPWSLWPHHRELFARSWARFFTTQPFTHWTDTTIVQAFLDKAEALAAVRDALISAERAKVWHQVRSCIEAQLREPWLSASQRSALNAVLAVD